MTRVREFLDAYNEHERRWRGYLQRSSSRRNLSLRFSLELAVLVRTPKFVRDQLVQLDFSKTDQSPRPHLIR